MSAPAVPPVDLGAFAKARYVGARIKRVEDPRFLTGEARFVGDIVKAGLLEATFLRSDQAHAVIRGVDVTEAAALPGVVAVFTAEDVEAEPLVDLLRMDELIKTPRPALAESRVRYVGEPIALVVAESRYIAEDALEHINVDLDPLPAVVDVEEAVVEGCDAQLFDHVPDNVYYRTSFTAGSVDEAFASAAHVVERKIRTNRYMAAPMEPRGAIADYEPSTGELTYCASTQVPHSVRGALANSLRIPEHRIRVTTPAVGGGFGQKNMEYPEDLALAYASIQLGRPIRWEEDRPENLVAAAHAKEQCIDLAAAVDEGGRILAMRARVVGDAGAYSFGPPSGLIECMLSAMGMTGVYDIPAYAFELVAGLTNKSPISPYRGVGYTAAQTARETLIDEIAREIGMDPLAVRRRNMIRDEQMPYTTVTGAEYDSGSYQASLELAVERLGYEDFRAEQQRARQEGRYLGVGFSPFIESTGWGSKAAIESGIPFASHDNATVTVELSGAVTVDVSTHSHGQGHETSFAQVVAETLGVPLDTVRIVQGDTARAPYGMGTWASRSAIIGAGTVGLAAQDVRGKLLKLAGALLECDPGDLDIDDGVVHVKGSPEVAIPVTELAGAAYFAPVAREVLEGDPYPSATRFYEPPAATYSNGVVAVVVEVDAETGLVELRRVVAVEDCGTMLNPLIVEGQVQGGFVQGLGGALYEQLVYDDNGQPLCTTFMDYLVPRSSELTQIEVEHLETPSPHTFGGVKGMGEGSSIAAPAAVVNAVMDALSPFGPRFTRLPLSPCTVWEAIRERRTDD